MSEPLLPTAHGGPVLTAAIRSVPEDFVVEEIDAFPPSGQGEHLLLSVEKRGMNTGFAAQRIAHWAGVAESAIGYAGMKDRHAVTRQRFSVWLPKKVAPDIVGLQSDDLKVLASDWHARKLSRGALAGNRFVLTLRDVQGDTRGIEARLATIAANGVPNYFGGQRFGRGGGNVEAALAMFSGRRVHRAQRSILLSAARSELFNRVLASRVESGNWHLALEGEVLMLDGSRSVFGPEAWTDALQQRLDTFDIHPTAPLWGRGELRSAGEARAVEAAAISSLRDMDLRSGLEKAGLKQERRATRLRPERLQWEWLQERVLRVEFRLPPGSYATAVLAELMGPTTLPG